MKKKQETYELRARIFKALSHPSRLMIVDALQEGPRMVGDLVDLVGAEYATVSNHLAKLKQAGIVAEDRKEKNHVYYRLEVTCIGGFFTCVGDVLSQRKKALDGEMKKKRRTRAR